ncbi:hypothetical protein ABTN55_19365, partial [Acinetobacter baumannii]
VGTGFDDRTVEQLSAELLAMQTSGSPFQSNDDDIPRNAVFVQPKVVVQIRFAERTPSGMLRHASYLGRREDKEADEVTPERPTNRTEYGGVRVTHP